MPHRSKNVVKTIKDRRGMLKQESVACKVQLVNKLREPGQGAALLAGKNIMTGFNVALRMRRDPFVAEIDYDLLTARKDELSAHLINSLRPLWCRHGRIHD